MIKIFKKTNERTDEEEKKAETEEESKGYTKQKRSPGEIRLKKELQELDLPAHAAVNYPDTNNIMKFEVSVDLTKEDCIWKGGKYTFTVNIPHTYPHEAPKCLCQTQIYHPNIDL